MINDRTEIEATAEHISPWEQLKQGFREGLAQGRARREREEALRRECNTASLAGLRMRLNDLEHDLADLFARKWAMSWDQPTQPDAEIEQVLDDWRTVCREIERRSR